MKHDSLQFTADTAVLVGGSFAGLHVSELAGLIVVITNLIYVIIRLVDRFKNKTS